MRSHGIDGPACVSCSTYGTASRAARRPLAFAPSCRGRLGLESPSVPAESTTVYVRFWNLIVFVIDNVRDLFVRSALGRRAAPLSDQLSHEIQRQPIPHGVWREHDRSFQVADSLHLAVLYFQASQQDSRIIAWLTGRI